MPLLPVRIPLFLDDSVMDHIALQLWQLFQESLKANWHDNQDSSMVERQVRDLEVRVRVPVQVRSFLLKFNNVCL